MCKPEIQFDDTRSAINGKSISKVPIIRIFGVDDDGRKICLHVHGFYPYVAIQNKDPQDPDMAGKIVTGIERALSDVVDENRRKQQQQQSTSGSSQPIPSELENESNLEARLHQERVTLSNLSADQRYPIHRIESVQAYNYYGYHHKPEPFFKLYLYNPRMVKQLAFIFEDARVLSRFIPVFWAHLPYVLLFFIDNNLRGMQFIDVESIYWRRGKAPKPSDDTDPCAVLQPRSSHEQNRTDTAHDIEMHTSDIVPTSTCELEADIRYEWILNSQKFGAKGNDDALRELWLDDQAISQGSSTIDSRLPLFPLEKSYIQQLCDSYGVNSSHLDLEISDRPQPIRSQPNIPYSGDSDDSLEMLLDRQSSFESPHDSPQPRASPPDDEDFSDDEFFKNIPTIKEDPAQVKQEPCLKVATKSERLSEAGIKQELGVVCKRETSQDEEEFDDDDQFLVQAVIKAETQDPSLKSQNTSAAKERVRHSDNSIIDGRSVVCSTANQTKTGSQRSTSSSREAVSHEYQHLSMMSMELHVTTRETLRPDPAFDPIEAIFYCVRNDTPETSNIPSQVIGMVLTDPFRDNNNVNGRATSTSPSIMRSPSARSNMSFVQKIRTLLHKTGLSMRDIELNIVDSEMELIMSLVELVKIYDPEILLGYEIEYHSWGYLLERANILNINVSLAISRITNPKMCNNSKVVESNFVQPVMFAGRMVFSVWRIIKHEINLNTCSFERIYQHALNERVPCFPFEVLTKWFTENRNRWRVIDYYLTRVEGHMRILDRFDLIAKVSELARVYGTQFIDVITRGSQIGIESMMLRLAKLQNLTPLSPTVMQRNKMKAPEALPLVMEPETNIYYDPVAVLDFQSLYPSVVIAYNYCYSTCLGRVTDLEGKERHNFGCSQLHVDEQEMKSLLQSNSVHISPCGVAYVKKNIRHGVLPKMLSELIVTRAMVKDQMKKNLKSERPNRRLQRILDHRQHGLKMMANTTYGYTGASYTGRMPCVEIADSIVSKGRETLENAIELVESRAEWGAKVIYGDTDSIFIQFKDCDRDTAFKRAYEMVDAISASNPHPIKMKFEKIYQPCVLQTKKRYCGFKYENPDQVKPEFEAKGIETVRRDCCPAAARMLEMALRIQFTTRDVEQVKKYCQHQFVKIMSGKLSNIQDFIFARQYKPRDLEKTESVFVPAWQIAKRLLLVDPRAEPRLGERVPFVIIYGEPRTPLVNLAKTPIEVLENLSYRVNSDYYITKIICPTLNRVFCTMKVDTLLWYKSMPHQNIIHRSHYLVAQMQQRKGASSIAKQSTMSQYFSPSHCPVCARSIPISDDICDSCHEDLQSSIVRLTEEIAKNQRKLHASHQQCRACSSLERYDHVEDNHNNPCISYDCQNLFRYHQAKLDVLNSNYLSQILKTLC